jgi:hypothetical protein
MKIDIRDFSEISRENLISIKIKKNTLHENVFIFMTIFRRILLRVRNVLNKSCRENQNIYFTFNNFFPKIVPFVSNIEKYGGARGTANGNTARYMLN